METFRLIRHPDSPQDGARAVTAEVSLAGRLARIAYIVDGLDEVRLAPVARPERRDGLWQTTCFELFTRRPGAAAYREYNFAPSGEWAAYAFSGYRTGMSEVDMAAPRISRVPDGILVELELDQPVQFALSAVIEALDGTIVYWALAHRPGKPDFHHPACFVASLAAPPT